jgi:peptide deformylase
MLSHKVAVGLAAPQIGVDLQVAVVGPSRVREQIIVICNPSITTSGSRLRRNEACMSVPGFAAQVERREKATVRYHSIDGAVHSLRVTGFLARVFMHEIDHLNGILYIDHLSSLDEVTRTNLFDAD